VRQGPCRTKSLADERRRTVVFRMEYGLEPGLLTTLYAVVAGLAAVVVAWKSFDYVLAERRRRRENPPPPGSDPPADG
jgi:hypothetical protein